MCRDDPQGSKEGGCQPIICPTNLPETIVLEFILAERYMHMSERALSHTKKGQGQDDWSEGTWKAAAMHANEATPRGGAHFSSACVLFYIHCASNKCFTCFPISVSVEFFLQGRQGLTSCLSHVTPRTPLRSPIAPGSGCFSICTITAFSADSPLRVHLVTQESFLRVKAESRKSRSFPEVETIDSETLGSNISLQGDYREGGN